MFSKSAEKQTATATQIIYFLTNQKKQSMSTPNKSSVGLQNPQQRNQLFNFKNARQGGLIGILSTLVILFSISSCYKKELLDPEFQTYENIFKKYKINSTKFSLTDSKISNKNSFSVTNTNDLEQLILELRKPKELSISQDSIFLKCTNCPRAATVSFGTGQTYRIDYTTNASGGIASVTNMYSVGFVSGSGFTMTSSHRTSSGAIIEGYHTWSILGGFVGWQFNDFYRFTISVNSLTNGLRVSRLAIMY
jgi:hypothetical protein